MSNSINSLNTVNTDTDNYFHFIYTPKFSQMQRYTSQELEDDHEFIQWIFPTTTKSKFNKLSPIIKINELRSNQLFEQAKLLMSRHSLKLMLKHWGISSDMKTIFNKDKFKLLNGHNGVRLSRVLQSLVYHDLLEIALTLFTIVVQNIPGLLVPFYDGDNLLWIVRINEAIKEVEKSYSE